MINHHPRHPLKHYKIWKECDQPHGGFNGAIVKIYSPGILQNNKIQVNCLPTARTPGHLCDEDNYDVHDDYNEYDQYKI